MPMIIIVSLFFKEREEWIHGLHVEYGWGSLIWSMYTVCLHCYIHNRHVVPAIVICYTRDNPFFNHCKSYCLAMSIKHMEWYSLTTWVGRVSGPGQNYGVNLILNPFNWCTSTYSIPSISSCFTPAWSSNLILISKQTVTNNWVFFFATHVSCFADLSHFRQHKLMSKWQLLSQASRARSHGVELNLLNGNLSWIHNLLLSNNFRCGHLTMHHEIIAIEG